MCLCLDQLEMVTCINCEPLAKSQTGKWNFFIPLFVFLAITALILLPMIGVRIGELQEQQFQRRLALKLQYELNEGVLLKQD